MDMKIERIQSEMIDELLLARINNLLCQLSVKATMKSLKDLKRIIRNLRMILVGIFDKKGNLAGMAAIHFKETLMRKTGTIEDVVVDRSYRGRGFGRKLTEFLIEEANKRKADCVELTSNPKRIEAIAMYESLGFKKRDTNCYRLDILV